MRHNSQIEPLDIKSSEFSPIGSQFLGKYIVETESAGGILMPEQDTWWAEVIRIGPDCTVAVGEKVLMQQYQGENIDLSDGQYTIFDESFALAACGS